MAKNSEIKPQDPGIAAIRVRSAGETGFWRAGRKFTSQPIEILLSELSDEQIEAIERETNLIAERITLSAQCPTAPART